MKMQNFDDAVAFAKECLTQCGEDAANKLGEPMPKVIEETTLTGVRLVLEWADGERTNDAVINRTDNQVSFAG